MGPLPQLHKVLIVSFLMITCMGLGVWVAAAFGLSLDGIGIGLGAGCLLAYLMTHDFTRRPPRSVRITRRH